MSDNILVLYGYGLDIRMSYGRLKIKHGFPTNNEKIEVLIDRGTNQIEHIIVLGQTGLITFEAMAWIVAQNMMVTFFDGFGNVITEIAPNNNVPMSMMKKQMNISDKCKFNIIHWLLQEKFIGQAEAVNYLYNYHNKDSWYDDERKRLIEQTLEAVKKYDVSNVNDVHQLTVMESSVAFVYWKCFKDIPLKWSGEKKIPQNWKYINNRKSPKTGNCNNSIDPFNACLNYAYAIISSMLKLECIKNLIDVNLGLLHTTEKYQASLVCDLIEPLRGKVDKLVLEYFLSRTFSYKDFYETSVGICKISKNVINDMVQIAYSLENDVEDIVFAFRYMINHEKTVEKKSCIDCNNIFIPKASYQKRCSCCV